MMPARLSGKLALQDPCNICRTTARHPDCCSEVGMTKPFDPLPGIWFRMQVTSVSSVMAVEQDSSAGFAGETAAASTRKATQAVRALFRGTRVGKRLSAVFDKLLANIKITLHGGTRRRFRRAAGGGAPDFLNHPAAT
jgi:hypothetical protein